MIDASRLADAGKVRKDLAAARIEIQNLEAENEKLEIAISKKRSENEDALKQRDYEQQMAQRQMKRADKAEQDLDIFRKKKPQMVSYKQYSSMSG